MSNRVYSSVTLHAPRKADVILDLSSLEKFDAKVTIFQEAAAVDPEDGFTVTIELTPYDQEVEQ